MNQDVELWGTFAVADHLRPRPFVTDVLLYDRLVLPVPKAGHREKEWRTIWAADRLSPLLDELGDLAVPMPWGDVELEDGLRRHGKARAVMQDMRTLREVDPAAPANQVTRAVLADYANAAADNALFARLRALAKRPGSRIEAVTAYGSAADLRNGVGMGAATSTGPEPVPIRPAAVFDWTVHVPDGESDIGLLQKAIRLAQRSDYREHRSHFYNRLRDLSALSDDEVRKDLLKRLADYDRLMRRQGWHTAARRATQVLMIGSPLLALLEPLSGALAGMAITANGVLVSEHLDLPEPDDLTRVAAMAHDIRAEFGDRLRLGSA